MPGADIFISYSSLDQARVRQYVDAFTAAGLTVWWDKDIERDRWGDAITDALASARSVVLFLSRASMASGMVFAEARRAADAGKLIPVWIEKVPPPYDFDGLIARLFQHFMYDPGVPAGADMQRLCRACGAEVAAVPPPEMSEGSRIAHWIASNPPVEDVALCLSVAMLENASYSVVDEAARYLTELLSPSPETAKPKRKPFVLRQRSHQLKVVEAECFSMPHDRWERIAHECVRFVRPGRAFEVLDYAWRELDGIQEPLCRWLAMLAASTSRPLKVQTGLVVGKLAQSHFLVILDRLIQPWAVADDADRRETADIALCVAAFDPDVRRAAQEVLASWTSRHAPLAERRAAAEFLTGYTGARFPEETLPLLRKLVGNAVSSNQLGDVVGIVRDAIERLFQRAASDEDSSLLDVPGLLTGLADWITNPEKNEPADISIHFFLFAVSMLPLDGQHKADRLCLSAVMADDAGRRACVQGFGAGLLRPEMQESIRFIVNRWIEERRGWHGRSDPLAVLREDLNAAAASPRDRARIVHLFRHAGPPHSPAAVITLTSRSG